MAESILDRMKSLVGSQRERAPLKGKAHAQLRQQLRECAAGTGGEVDDSMHLRSSVGFSVFWDTPIGPLRFNFSQPLASEDYDKTQSFDLTISTRF